MAPIGDLVSSRMRRARQLPHWILRLVVAAGLGFFAGSIVATTPNDQSPSDSTGAISGTVVDGVTGQVLAGATVTLTWEGRLAPLKQLTEAKGRFLFDHLAAHSDYLLTVGKPGYANGRYGQSTSNPEAPAPRLSLANGQWLRDLRLSITRLPAVSGTVLDDRGEPIVGAYVRILKRFRIGDQVQLATGNVARTDDRGFYRIAQLQAGDYLIELLSVQAEFPSALTTRELVGEPIAAAADARGTVPSWPASLMMDELHALVIGHYPVPPRAADGSLLVYPITFYPSAGSPDLAIPVTVGTADRSGLDLHVTPVHGGRISGVLTGPAGSFENRRIRLILPGADALGNGSEVATAISDARGTFTFVNVPPGTYVVDANPHPTAYDFSNVSPTSTRVPAAPGTTSGYGAVVSVASRLTIETRPTDNPFTGQTRVTADGSDVDGVVVPMQRTAWLSGRIVWEGTRGGGLGILQMSSALGDPSLGYLISHPDAATPDLFIIEGLLTGEYVFELDRVAAVNGSAIRSVRCEGADYTYAAIRIAAGSDVTDCIVTVTSEMPTLSGIVAGAAGKGSAVEAAVLAFPVEREQWRGFGVRPARFVGLQVKSDGRFEMRSLPAGDYYVVAVPAAQVDAWQDSAFLERAAGQASRVRLTWGAASVQNLMVQDIK